MASNSVSSIDTEARHQMARSMTRLGHEAARLQRLLRHAPLPLQVRSSYEAMARNTRNTARSLLASTEAVFGPELRREMQAHFARASTVAVDRDPGF